MSFLQCYKRLDNLCKDICGSETGVTSYIESMERIPAGAYRVAGWHDDYRQLNHYRYIRNKIVHDNDADEDTLCSATDIDWIENFYWRIMNGQDPLTLYRKATTPKQPPQTTSKHRHSNTPYTQSKRNSGCLFSVLIILGIVVAFVALVL